MWWVWISVALPQYWNKTRPFTGDPYWFLHNRKWRGWVKPLTLSQAHLLGNTVVLAGYQPITQNILSLSPPPLLNSLRQMRNHWKAASIIDLHVHPSLYMTFEATTSILSSYLAGCFATRSVCLCFLLLNVFASCKYEKIIFCSCICV